MKKTKKKTVTFYANGKKVTFKVNPYKKKKRYFEKENDDTPRKMIYKGHVYYRR